MAEPTLLIRQGRHPVIERVLPSGSFVPNDIALDADSQVLIVTGPNMSGKSTILRQVALITLLAHLGSFVPAAEAVIGLTDRIFTRVGAVDDIGRGQSTFLVEMHETARILHQATPRSLVILDEIGRGTSTFDGLALAWAVAEHLHDLEGAGVKTLFATHYQELTELSRLKPRVQNFQVLVTESAGDIVFLHRLAPGAASQSYGIQVAKLAGVPREVIARAQEVLENLESGSLDPTGLPRLARSRRRPTRETPQPTLFDPPPEEPQLVIPVRAGARAIEDDSFPFEAISDIAEMESWRKEINRPLSHIHKWWAQRLGTVFRAVVLSALAPKGSDVLNLFYSRTQILNAVVFDPFMGSGTTITETVKLGARAVGRDINPVAYFLVRNALAIHDRDGVFETFHAIERDVAPKLLSFYEAQLPDGQLVPVLYYFWVMTVPCPQCQTSVDLFSSYVFAKHAYPQKFPEARAVCPYCGEVNKLRFDATEASCSPSFRSDGTATPMAKRAGSPPTWPGQ